jgi:ribosomal protein L11 methyltransferase
VIANIITDHLLAMATDLAALVAPGGTLITSGVAVDRTDEASQVFTAAGLDVTARPGREWSVLTATAPTGRPRPGSAGWMAGGN